MLSDLRTFLPMLEFIADRTEGNATQNVKVQERRVTIFRPADTPASSPSSAATGAAGPSAGSHSIAGGSEPMPYVPLRPQV